MTTSGWVDVATVASGFEADLMIARLEAAGIRALRDDNDTVGIFGPGFQGPTARGVTVRVPAESLDDAQAVLEPDSETPSRAAYRAQSGAEHDDVTVTMRDRRRATQDECAEQDLADLAVGLQTAQQLVAMELDNLAVVLNTDANERRTACDQRSLTGKLAGPIDVDHDVALRRRPEDLGRPTPNDEEVELPIARFDEHLAGRHRSRAAIRLDTLDLRGVRVGKRRSILGCQPTDTNG